MDGERRVKQSSPRGIKRVLIMFDDRCPVGLERYGDDVDADRLILEPMAPDIRRGKLGNPTLLLIPDRFGGMAVLGIRTAAYLDKHHRAAVNGDDVDVATKHPYTAAHNPVAEFFEVADRFLLTPTAKLVT
jgi:hypothetical protein